MRDWIDALTPATPPVFDPQVEKLKELAAEIGSNVVFVRDCVTKQIRVEVDALDFDSIDAAIRHCQEVA